MTPGPFFEKREKAKVKLYIIFEGIAMAETKELVISNRDTWTPEKVYEPGAINKIVDFVEKEALAHVPDISTDKGRKAVISNASDVAKAKKILEKCGVDLGSTHREAINKINTSKKSMIERMDAIKIKARKPVTDWEQAEVVRVEKTQAKISTIKQFRTDFREDSNSDNIKILLDNASGLVIDESYEEFQEFAQQELDIIVEFLATKYDAKAQHEKDQAELAEFKKEKAEREAKEYEDRLAAKKKEHEAKLAQDAKEKADKEAAETIRLAEEKADNEKKDAIRKQEEAEVETKRLEEEKKEAVQNLFKRYYQRDAGMHKVDNVVELNFYISGLNDQLNDLAGFDDRKEEAREYIAAVIVEQTKRRDAQIVIDNQRDEEQAEANRLQAVKDKEAAELKAEEDKKAAVALAKENERKRIEKENQEAADIRLANEAKEQKRISDQKHRDVIENKVIEFLVNESGISHAAGCTIVKAIAEGKSELLKINY